MYSILIVEDDKGLNQGIALALKDGDTEFVSVYSLAQARAFWREKEADMVLLDINLPDGSGYDFLKEVRQDSQIPVLMLTANDLEIDEVTGFSLGADDYITKPFSLMVLRARVERMRARTVKSAVQEVYEDSCYRFLIDEMRYFVEGQEVTLSKTEQKLLHLFLKNKGQTLTREMLIDALWTDGAQYVDENALSVTVNRLRHKLDGKQKRCPIQTIYGIGYVWEKN